MTPLVSFKDHLDRFRGEYDTKKGIRDGGEVGLIIAIVGEVINRGLVVSNGTVYLKSENSIRHLEGSCIAASFVTMVAKKTLDLGSQAMESKDPPVRIFAPYGLTLIADVVLIGNLEFIPPLPAVVSIVCQRLGFVRRKEQARHPQLEWLTRGLVNRAKIEEKVVVTSEASDSSEEEEAPAAASGGGSSSARTDSS